MTSFITAKTILSGSASKVDPWFGTTYTINLYRGCSHGCIYCDSRSKCYQIADFDNIQVKLNALDLLNNELRTKKKRGTIGFGSMNDCYMPLENRLLFTRRALELVHHYRFPVHIITKDTLITRDIDLLQKIGQVYAAVSITITAASDSLSQQIEPHAPLSSERFQTIRTLADAGIYCGITLMPVIPFITDSYENIEQLIGMAKEAGAQYIIAAFGMTLREGNREYFYRQLDQRFPGLKQEYIKQFGDQYNCSTPHTRSLYQSFKKLCQQAGIDTQMKFYTPPRQTQGVLF